MSIAPARRESSGPSRAVVMKSLLRAAGRPDGTRRPDTAEVPAPFDVQSLDSYLEGGLPAGQLSEVAGPASSGRTTLVWRWLAAATRQGRTVALVDAFDRFDPESAAACGIDLDRLLWIRGQAVSKTGGAVDPLWLPGVRAVDGPGTMVERTVDRALAALDLVLRSGVCPIVVVDMLDVPPAALRRIPYTTWLRVQRAVEGGGTTCVLLAPESTARSAGGITLTVQAPGRDLPVAGVEAKGPALPGGSVTTQAAWRGDGSRGRRFDGLRLDVRVSSSRRRAAGRVSLAAEPRTERRQAGR